MPGNPPQLRRVQAGALEIVRELDGFLGVSAIWTKSGRGGQTGFARWASASQESPAPTFETRNLTLNCWEAVLLPAVTTKRLSWQWAHDLYTRTEDYWDGELRRRLAPNGLTRFDPDSPQSSRPIAGDVVIWDDNYLESFPVVTHVAVAAGRCDANGRDLVYSFWAPPERSAKVFMPEHLKTTTIQELTDYIKKDFEFTPVVGFGDGPWAEGTGTTLT